MEIKLNTDNFDANVLNSDKPVLVDFFATWCGPCKMMAPIVEELSEEMSDKINVGVLNIDESIEIAQKYKVTTIPTLMLFKNGEGKVLHIGYMAKDEFKELLESKL